MPYKITHADGSSETYLTTDDIIDEVKHRYHETISATELKMVDAGFILHGVDDGRHSWKVEASL